MCDHLNECVYSAQGGLVCVSKQVSVIATVTPVDELLLYGHSNEFCLVVFLFRHPM